MLITRLLSCHVLRDLWIEPFSWVWWWILRLFSRAECPRMRVNTFIEKMNRTRKLRFSPDDTGTLKALLTVSIAPSVEGTATPTCGKAFKAFEYRTFVHRASSKGNWVRRAVKWRKVEEKFHGQLKNCTFLALSQQKIFIICALYLRHPVVWYICTNVLQGPTASDFPPMYHTTRRNTWEIRNLNINSRNIKCHSSENFETYTREGQPITGSTVLRSNYPTFRFRIPTGLRQMNRFSINTTKWTQLTVCKKLYIRTSVYDSDNEKQLETAEVHLRVARRSSSPVCCTLGTPVDWISIAIKFSYRSHSQITTRQYVCSMKF